MTETDSINDSAMQVLLNKATQLWWRCEAAVEKVEQRIKTFMESTQEKPGTPVALGDSNCTDQSVRGSDSAHVNVNRIEISEKTLSIFALVLAAAAIVVACWAISESHNSEREARMLQYYLLELDARVIAAGIKKPDEAISKDLEKEKR